MIGLTNLTTNGRVFVEPKLNRRRALFVLDKVDKILSWEHHAEQEKDTRFVELVDICVKSELANTGGSKTLAPSMIFQQNGSLSPGAKPTT